MFNPKTTAVILAAYFFILFSTQAFAADLLFPKTVINPDKYLLYNIKRLTENGLIYTKWGEESKSNYLKDLTLTRGSELKYVVENNLLGDIEHSSQRFSYQVGTLSDFIATNPKLSNKKQNVTDFLTSFKKPLEGLRDKNPSGSSYWLLVQQNIDSIDINLEKLK